MTIKLAQGRLFFSLSFFALLSSSYVSAGEFEDLSNIRQIAEQFALAQIENTAFSDITAQAASMDARLQLKKCSEVIEAFTTGRAGNIARTTVGVRCNGVDRWTLYVPVVVSALVDVVYTTRPFIRGESIRTEDVEIRKMSIEKLPPNYMGSTEKIEGMEFTRTVRSGAVLTLNSLKQRKAVQQGQEVIIFAKGHGLEVRMSGKALKNGSLGDSIPVRNMNSGRTIEATIIDDGTVSVLF